MGVGVVSDSDNIWKQGSQYMHWYLWNAKLTETQIFRELSIEIESSRFN